RGVKRNIFLLKILAVEHFTQSCAELARKVHRVFPIARIPLCATLRNKLCVTLREIRYKRNTLCVAKTAGFCKKNLLENFS
ncbi:MAG: hypothetical protein KDD14_11960, partial [Saprospiraceae bacterium]|nr:hypothetical protein [Saprospiraceae bacterium]